MDELPPVYKLLSARLQEKIERDANSTCWLWPGASTDRGYGIIEIGLRRRLTHRVAYEIENKVILLPKETVCHRCDVPACINPAHLWVGSQKDNMKDMAEKGRGRTSSKIGELNNRAKLTASDVLEMRRLKALGWKHRDLSRRFGVGMGTVHRNTSGKNWRHISNG